MKSRPLLVFLLVCLALGASLSCAPSRKAPQATVEPTNTLRPTFTDVPPATDTPAATATFTVTPTEPATPTAEPSATPEPTATPTRKPTRVPPTPTPRPTNTPAPQVGSHGVLGKLRLRQNRTDYAVREKIFFVFEAENHTDRDIPFGILGMKADNGQFQTSWSSDAYSLKIDARSVFSRDDNMAFSAPGTYTVRLAICFSAYADCSVAGADWEEFSPGVVVNVR